MDNCEIRISKESDPNLIALVLNLDDKYRKDAVQKMKRVARKTRA